MKKILDFSLVSGAGEVQMIKCWARVLVNLFRCVILFFALVEYLTEVMPWLISDRTDGETRSFVAIAVLSIIIGAVMPWPKHVLWRVFFALTFAGTGIWVNISIAYVPCSMP